jgi:predicted RNA-binding Zn ribbon-like protein
MPSVVSFDAGPQPAGREPAPGPLGLVQAFVNSSGDLRDGRRGEEVWADGLELARWLRRRGLLARGQAVTDRDLTRALTVRDAIRALLIANNGGRLDGDAVARLKRAVPRPAMQVEFRGLASHVTPPSQDVEGALRLVVALVYDAMRDGRWERFKACRDPECRWAFYDHSRNQTSAWCSMAVCGARDKVRNYRRRQQAARTQRRAQRARRSA